MNKILNMLYLSHAPWGWIKQRPHFVAENLCKVFNVNIVYPKYYRTKRLVKNAARPSLNIKELFVLPYQRFNVIKKLNSILWTYQLSAIIKKVDIVWLTHPSLFAVVEAILPNNAFLIYDCMDDAFEFTDVRSKKDARKSLSDVEERLVNRCDIVFTSSENLRHKIISRYNISDHVYTVNNAMHKEDFTSLCETSSLRDIDNALVLENVHQKKLVYIGTISEWLDFDLIFDSLTKYQDVCYILIGPSEIPLPKHKRIYYCRPVAHHKIFGLMQKADALVMPFKVNELIQSVNPVKLYEYIYSCKPVISVAYQETNRFSDFIYTYHNRDEYLRLVGKMLQGSLMLKKGCEESIAFACENTWEKRVQEITSVIMDKYRH